MRPVRVLVALLALLVATSGCTERSWSHGEHKRGEKTWMPRAAPCWRESP